MKQIYYTQCPQGYGLGATNGFQIKRLDEGYPVTADLRLLGLRAFLPGSRDLAPCALRYRRDGAVAEIAWLSPRTHEYETEQGRRWGRPGGQFAHGLRLEGDELAAIESWPAGLYGQPFWVPTDPERTRGRPPLPLSIADLTFLTRPEPAAVASLEASIPRPYLAALLTALQHAVEESRTLFLVTAPEKLGTVVALLTFAIPQPLREAISFSTYHDRPEELTGFRLQGTTPGPALNRALLRSLGWLADLGAGSIDPPIAPAPWATTLAAWIREGGGAGSEAWSRTSDRARAALAARASSVETLWSSTALDGLVLSDRHTQPPAPLPNETADWAPMLAVWRWLRQVRLESRWIERHDRSWWGLALDAAPAPREAIILLASQIQHPATWTTAGDASDERARGWAVLLARAGQDMGPDVMLQAILAAVRGLSPRHAPAFLAAAVSSVPLTAGRLLLAELERDDRLPERLLVPLAAIQTARQFLDDAQPDPLKAVLERALAEPASLAPVLDTIAQAAVGRSALQQLTRDWVAAQLAAPTAPFWGELWAWAVQRGDAPAWIDPHLARCLAASETDTRDELERLLKATPPTGRDALIRSLFDHAGQEPSRTDVYRWTFERLLLPERDLVERTDPAWTTGYLQRLSGLDLLNLLFLAGRNHDLRAWIARFTATHGMDSTQAGRIERCRAFAEALRNRDPHTIDPRSWPDTPAVNRGEFLRILLRATVGESDLGALQACLAQCRQAWSSQAFDPADAGCAGIGHALARWLAPRAGSPDQWIEGLLAIHEALDDSPGELPPLGVAGVVVRESMRLDPSSGTQANPLRTALLRRDRAWPALFMDSIALLRTRHSRERNDALNQLELQVIRGQDDRERRFHELLVNAGVAAGCVELVVAHRVSTLLELGPLAWWPAAGGSPGTDLREAFARHCPMAPMAGDFQFDLRRWLAATGTDSDSSGCEIALEVDLRPQDQVMRDRPVFSRDTFPLLSELGWARWRCVDALGILHRPGLTESGRWQTINSWQEHGLPLEKLGPADQRAFVAGVIAALEHGDNDRDVALLARWLLGQGYRSPDWVSRWSECWLGPPLDSPLRPGRRELVGKLRQELREAIERPAARSGPDAAQPR